MGYGPYGREEFDKTEVTLHSWLLTKYGPLFTKQNLKHRKSKKKKKKNSEEGGFRTPVCFLVLGL